MSSNRNQKRGKYMKSCYHSKKAADLGDNYCPDSIYEFAVGYKKFEDFISEYSGEHEGYSFVGSEERKTQKQTNNARNFCVRCNGVGFARYSQCDYRQFVEDENVIAIALADKTDTGGAYCNNCKQRVFFSKHCKEEAKSTVQDVRLHERPTKMTVSRLRYYCPHCHTFIGMKYLPDFQAYCGGGMTARLAASVLYSQLSAVKREYIAEAYGLSKSQIDRIKKRMIDQAKEAKLILLYKNVNNNLNSEVICKVFKDKKSRHVYYAYFLKTKTGDIQLINIITQAERDAAADWNQNPASFIKRFPQYESFSFMCFCILAGEMNIHGQKLKEQLDKLSDWYDLLKNPENMHSKNYFYQNTPEGGAEKRILLNYLRRMPTAGFEVRSDVADIVNGSTVNFSMPSSSTSSDSENSIVSFISSVASAQQGGNAVSYKELINRLLYFNPAVIREAEVRYLVEGARFDADARVFYLELNVGSPPPFGAPISCLEHFIENGLLREDNTRLMPCILTQSSTEDRPNERPELPCGLSCSNCPHLATTKQRENSQ